MPLLKEGDHDTLMMRYFIVEPPSLWDQRSPAFFPIRFWPNGDCGVMTTTSSPSHSSSKPPLFGPMKYLEREPPVSSSTTAVRSIGSVGAKSRIGSEWYSLMESRISLACRACPPAR